MVSFDWSRSGQREWSSRQSAGHGLLGHFIDIVIDIDTLGTVEERAYIVKEDSRGI